MPLALTWEQITLRLLLACIASFLIGFNRDEQGHPAGIRTTMLVCLAATLAMLQVNLLLPISGKTNSSFAVMDLMRLPLGILSGIGFIGAGVIVKREGKLVTGVTTAATMWFVTVLGLLFGGGQLLLGTTGFVIAFLILWVLKYVERHVPREHSATLQLSLAANAPSEAELRGIVETHGEITGWNVLYRSAEPLDRPAHALCTVECELKWRVPGTRSPCTPEMVQRLRAAQGVLSLRWDE